MRSLMSFLALAVLGPASILAEDLKLTILHTNDMHARFEQTSSSSGACPPTAPDQCYGGFARVAHVVREARDRAESGEGPQVLYLVAGDTYQGTAWYTANKSDIVTDFMNVLKPDAMCLGNHEFDDGVEGLIPFIDGAKFPLLAANIYHPDLQATKLKNSTVVDVKGKQIGIIGYVTPDTKILSNAGSTAFFDEAQAVRREAAKLRSQGVRTIIALGHSGFERDKEIARIPDVDIVVGGHTNTFLYSGSPPDAEKPEGPYPFVVEQKSGKLVPVVQAYAYTKYVGRIDVTVGEDGEIKRFDGQPVLLRSSVPQDDDVLRLLDRYRGAIERLKRAVVGRTVVFLDGDSNNCRRKECNFGNLITDAFLDYKISVYAGHYWTDTPVALYQGGGIRNVIDASRVDGNITRADILSVIPFDNRLVGVTLKGTHLKEALEWSVHSNGETSRGEFLQYSGIRVEYDLSRPAGKRLVSARVRCGLCRVPEYHPLDTTREYRVLVPQFLYNGGDGYKFAEWGYNMTVEDVNDAFALERYIKKLGTVYPDVQDRIVFINPATGSRGGKSSSSMLFVLSAPFVTWYLTFII